MNFICGVITTIIIGLWIFAVKSGETGGIIITTLPLTVNMFVLGVMIGKGVRDE
jgi:hypothetical protein